MEELEQLISRVWQQIGPRFCDDPLQLAQRLARRRQPVLTQPPRAWCLAVRASDTRLLPLDGWARRALEPHAVHLTADDLRRLCAPVSVTPPGETTHELARKLGTTTIGLRAARLAGVFRTRHIKGLGGARGRPVPLLYTPHPLDPSSRTFAAPDPA